MNQDEESVSELRLKQALCALPLFSSQDVESDSAFAEQTYSLFMQARSEQILACKIQQQEHQYLWRALVCAAFLLLPVLYLSYGSLFFVGTTFILNLLWAFKQFRLVLTFQRELLLVSLGWIFVFSIFSFLFFKSRWNTLFSHS